MDISLHMSMMSVVKTTLFCNCLEGVHWVAAMEHIIILNHVYYLASSKFDLYSNILHVLK